MKVWFCLQAASLTLALLVGGTPRVAAQPMTGAIFTTLGDGSAVNANHYDSKCAVYLDGGPGPNAPARAAGLRDGDYYFQVTDPSGKQLLSTDVVANRRFRVVNGVIKTYTGTGGFVHPIGIDRDHPELGAITIRLANATCPEDFLDSPNGGGVYKVWVTPVSDLAADSACGNGCFHGFVPSKSKTDNFKANSGTATSCLTIQKEFLLDNGDFERRPAWPFTVVDPLGVTNTYTTDDLGQVRVCGLSKGKYTVEESLPDGVTVVGLIVNGVSLTPDSVYSFTWKAAKLEPVIVFQNGGQVGQPQ